MTAEHNNIRKLIEVVNHPAAVLLYEWLNPDRSPITLDVRGTGYEVIACRLHDGWFSIVINGGAYKHPRCFLFHPNAIAALRSELKIKISQQGQGQMQHNQANFIGAMSDAVKDIRASAKPKTEAAKTRPSALAKMIEECQGELTLHEAAQLFGVPESLLQRWHEGRFTIDGLVYVCEAVCNTIAALRHEIESLEKELEEVRS